MNRKLCQQFVLDDSLLNDEQGLVDIAFEQHLEDCESCKQQLAELAGVDAWWTRAASHLSTVEQTEVPPEIVSQFSESASLMIPMSMGDDDPTLAYSDVPANKVSNSVRLADWQQILDPPTHPEMLGRIDQFEIESKIGSGGMGIVLKGFDRNLNRAVAIKILAPHLASNGTSRARFAREAQAAAAVVHPNVIPIYAVNSCETRPYIVMQLVSGHSLQSLVRERGPLEVKEIVRIAIQVADGLAAAHQQGLIHRDIKPANILIEHDVSRVVITDFGLARAADDAGMTQTGWIAGTPHYMSPEQSCGENLDCRSDLFSLGGLIYFLATGREPFRGEKPFAVIQKILHEQPTSPQVLNSDLPQMLSDIIERLLEKNPDDRFPTANSAREFLERYLAYLQQPLTAVKPKRLMTRRRRRARRLKVMTLVSAASLLAVGTISLLPMWTTGPGKLVPNVPESVSVSNTQPPATKTQPPATNTQPALPNTLPTLSNFFGDDDYHSEIQQLNLSLSELETSLHSTQPFARPDSPSSSESQTNFSSHIEQLKNDSSRFDQMQRAQIEGLKKLLRE